MSTPIFVTGLPRSGTSLVTGILALSGAWTGPTGPPSPWNRKGNFENETLKDRFVKAYLALAGADPLGLDPLPSRSMALLVSPELWRHLILGTVNEMGLPAGQPWLFKDAKLALVWRQWAEALPEARWIVVRRRRDAIIASALRAEPMARRLGYDWARWKAWTQAYLAHLEDMTAKIEVWVEIWPERDIFEDPAGMKPVVEGLGLTWRPDAVADFVDSRLWHPSEPAGLSAEAPAGA